MREIVTQADRQLLLTLPELDHGGPRSSGEYLGIPPQMPGRNVRWPDRGGCRVFAYLSAFPQLDKLLAGLSGDAFSTVIYSRDIGPEARARFPAIRFSDEPVDMGLVAREADLVVNMAGHTTSAQCLMAGTPQLMIPLRQEQVYLARRIAGQGAGIMLARDGDALDALDGARRMAAGGRLPFDQKRSAALTGPLLMERLKALFAEL